MSLLELLAHPVCRQLTMALLHFLWQGAVISIALALAVRMLKIRSASSRYACSLAALLLMAACVPVTLAWLSWPAGEQIAAGVAEPTIQVRDHASGPSIKKSPYLLPTWQPFVLSIWLTGVVLLSARLLVGATVLHRLRRERLLLPLEVADRVAQLGRRLRMNALPLVFLSRHVSEAIAVGLVRPLVLIPAVWATEMPLAMLEAVIAHELAHIRRRDLWVNLLQRLVESTLFYHPAVWWLSRRLRVERELCCDELAVAVTGRRLEYVEALETVARRRAARVQPALAASIRGEKNMRLLERVRNVLGLAGTVETSRLWPAGLVALMLPIVMWVLSLGVLSTASGIALADDDDRDEAKAVVRTDDDDDDEGDNEDEEGDDDEGDDEDEDRDDDEDGDDDKDGDDDDEEGDDDDDAKAVKKRGKQRKDADNEDGKEEKGDGDYKTQTIRLFKKEAGEKDVPAVVQLKKAQDGGDGPKVEVRLLKKVLNDGTEEEITEEKEIKKKPLKDGEAEILLGGEKKVRIINLKKGETAEEDGAEKKKIDSDARIEELTAIVKKLSVEVDRLHAELAEMRGAKDDDAAYRKKFEAARSEKRKFAEEDDAEASEKETFLNEIRARRKEARGEEERARDLEKEAQVKLKRAIIEEAKRADVEREKAERAAAEEKEAAARKEKEAKAIEDKISAALKEKAEAVLNEKEAAAIKLKEAAARKEKEELKEKDELVIEPKK